MINISSLNADKKLQKKKHLAKKSKRKVSYFCLRIFPVFLPSAELIHCSLPYFIRSNRQEGFPLVDALLHNISVSCFSESSRVVLIPKILCFSNAEQPNFLFVELNTSYGSSLLLFSHMQNGADNQMNKKSPAVCRLIF